MKKYLVVISAVFLISTNIYSQYDSPLKIPVYLSANFGELRNNHFHSGIDIKTQGVINKPVYSVADGYISRISVSPSGYGLALYITHPETGQTSVYGHLESFIPSVEKYVKSKQYEQESFRVNLSPEKNEFPVKRGQLIAYSGNTGSSGGPHVHFEIRDTETEHPLDPLVYYTDIIKDNVPPDLRGIAVYPIAEKGVVNNSSTPLRQNVTKAKNGNYLPLKTDISAWGTIGIGVKAYDKMSATSNIYGVKIVRLYVDDNKVFESDINRYSFDETRALNSFVDFEDWRDNKSFFMKSFIEPGNMLPFYSAINNGYITINKEKIYNIRYELEDAYGNVTKYQFEIAGKRQNVPPQKRGSLYMAWNENNYYHSNDFNLIVAKGNLYDDFIFTLRQIPDRGYVSDRFIVNDVPVPFHNKAEMSIRISNDTLSNKSQYCIVSIKRGKENWIGGKYNNGFMLANIYEAGSEYAVSTDNETPVITPIQSEKWETQKAIKIKVTDTKSGINTVKGYIDGKFALFENDVKSPIYTYIFDSERLSRNKTHTLKLIATDACGNVSEYSTEFFY